MFSVRKARKQFPCRSPGGPFTGILIQECLYIIFVILVDASAAGIAFAEQLQCSFMSLVGRAQQPVNALGILGLGNPVIVVPRVVGIVEQLSGQIVLAVATSIFSDLVSKVFQRNAIYKIIKRDII